MAGQRSNHPPTRDASAVSPTSEHALQAPPARLDLPRLEHEILQYWDAHDVEGRSLRGERASASGAHAQQEQEDFAFYDGPPFATGLPHYGHLLAGTIKDIVPRYWFMRGYNVERRFGWDCHGLPIESLVESELDVHGRAEIEALGVPKFNAACRAGVLRFTREWRTIVRRMGRWVDFENDYKTMDPTFMESVWWVFKQLWDKGLIYEGHRVQPVSPALGTPLSNFEVAQGPQEKDPVTRKDGHRRRQDPSLTVRFKLEDEDAYLWAWTTTPWTLPSNLALAVHPEVEYVKVRVLATGELAYVEPGRLATYQERERVGEAEVVARLRGADLVGRPYEPLLPYFEQFRARADGSRWAFRVVAADYVTTDSGTGIVHQAPAFGEDDFQTGKREGLPLVHPLDLNGVFDDSVPDFAGQFAKDADKGIVERLKREGKIVDRDTIVHPYPHCYRTDQPLLYMAISTWFMRVESMREQLVANNEQIHWVPEHVGSGRFGNWLAGARDWNLSRNRFWGTPLPLWRSDRDPSSPPVCVGSIAELEELAGLAPGSIDDLHRETIDPITWPAADGGTMRRVPEVFDCWFESGSMPYAQNHYPFDASTKAYVEHNLPADFIAEGLDQTRGWFYTLHVLAAALFGKPAFKHVIVNGLILAADGKKMSKRLKNYPDPLEVIESYGADALRAYLINSAVVRAEPVRFGKHRKDTSGEGVRDTVRLAILPLWNAYNFLVTYARADGWTPTAAAMELQPAGELDRWILSRVHGFVGALTAEYEAYNLSSLVPAYLEICDDLNNWYIRRGRRRYWRTRDGAGADRDKHEAYATLYRALVTIARAMAPVLPFFSEFLHRRLWVDPGLAGPGEDSVHLMPFPERDAALVEPALEAEVKTVRLAVTLAMALRERERIGVRRPLAALTVACPDEHVHTALRKFEDDVLGELNVKRLVLSRDDGELVSLSAKANFKVLGRRLGKRMKVVARAIQALDAGALQGFLSSGAITVEGEALGEGDILLVRAPKPGQVVASEGGLTVALDIEVDDALRHEGLAREVVSRVQSLRKEADLDVSQRILLWCETRGELARALARDELAAMIRGETLADAITLVDELAAVDAVGPGAPTLSDTIDGDPIKVALVVRA